MKTKQERDEETRLAVEAAIKNRDDYLASLEGEKKERALELQGFIDNRLLKAGNPQNRMTIISSMMWESFYKLNDVLKSFVSGEAAAEVPRNSRIMNKSRLKVIKNEEI